MLKALDSLMKWIFGDRQSPPPSIRVDTKEETYPNSEVHPYPAPEPQIHPIPYDENLLEKVRTQWQFGDWGSLAKLDRDVLQHHPDRARLAILAAAGHHQIGNIPQARQFVRLAQEWGCTKKIISQVLIAGVHNSLGRAAALAGEQSRALDHFESAIDIGNTGGDEKLITRARAAEQFGQLEFSPSVGAFPRPSLSTDNPETLIPGRIANTEKCIQETVKTEVQTVFQANNPNPYGHNRILTASLNADLRNFAERCLKRTGLKATYIDYLATKAIQIERTCVGRLATTVQDAVARQLVAECIAGDRICILEIGALYGVSLAILYNHTVTRYSSTRVVCLDPFDGYYGKAVDAALNQPVTDLTFVRNMRLANIPDSDYIIIKHYSNDPKALAEAEQLEFNLLIVDGDHSYDGVKFDFDAYFPLLKAGGLIIFDDYNAKEWPDVQRFIDGELRKTLDFEFLGFISRTAVGRKLEPATA